MFLGGTGSDVGSGGVSIDGLGNIIVAGKSNATWGSPVNAYTASNDSFVVKINESLNTPSVTPSVTVSATPTSTVTETITPTPTMTASISPTSTLSPTPTPTSSPWPTSPTATVTLTPSPTSTQTGQLPLIRDFIIYPNPVTIQDRPVTLQYALTQDAKVTIYIYTYLGSLVRRVALESGQPGAQGQPGGRMNQFTWDGRNQHGHLQAAGGYICKIVVSTTDRKESATLKIGLIR